MRTQIKIFILAFAFMATACAKNPTAPADSNVGVDQSIADQGIENAIENVTGVDGMAMDNAADSMGGPTAAQGPDDEIVTNEL